MVRLYTFQVSHFAEKARWALDWKGVRYDERRLLPGPHLAVTRRLGKTTSVPILVCDGRIVQGSSAIIDFADDRWPERPLTSPAGPERERAQELEPWLDHELGEPLRRVFYHHALPHRRLVTALFTERGPWWGRPFYRLAYGVLVGRIRALYRISPENVAADMKRLAAAFAKLDQLLEGRSYLVGEAFGRADLTLAALTAPLWDPPEHPTRWLPPDAYPAPLRELRFDLARTRAHDHVMSMYRQHRGQTH